MLRAIKLIALSVIFSTGLKAQVLYNETFSTLALSTYSSSTLTFKYDSLPASFTEIRDFYKSDSTDYNKPFNVPFFQRKGWAIYSPPALNDTFAVATSWLDSINHIKVDRWLITPAITNIAANSVLSWNSMAPDGNNRDGFEVYVTANTTGSLTVNDFNSANKVFGIYDIDNGGQGEATTWTKHGVSLSNYVGQSIKIAFRANSEDKFQLWVDDIRVENLSTGLDVALTDMAYSRYIFADNTDFISATVENKGAQDVSYVTLDYSVGINFPVSQVFSFSPPLGPYAVSQVTFAIPFSTSSIGYNPVKMYISGLNDNSQANDTLSSFLVTVGYNNYKKALLKKYVSAREGWTPDAQQISEGMALYDTNVVVMAVHQNDSMSIAAGNAMISTYSASIPSGAVDNLYWPDLDAITVEKGDWQPRVTLQEQSAAPVKISVLNKTYNAATRTLNFDIKLDFVTELKAAYNLNTSLTENNVCGPFNDNTLNGWNQLSNLHAVPTSAYYLTGAYYDGESYILNAYEFKHRQVMIEALDGANGDNTLIPATVSNGQSVTKSYSYVLPPAYANGNIYNADNIYIVSYVEEFNANLAKRQVVNTVQSKLTANAEGVPVGIQEQSADLPELNLYPNPAGSHTSVLYKNNAQKPCTLSLSNQLGEVLYSGAIDPKEGIASLDLSAYPPGIYFVTLDSDGRKAVKKLIISR